MTDTVHPVLVTLVLVLACIALVLYIIGRLR